MIIFTVLLESCASASASLAVAYAVAEVALAPESLASAAEAVASVVAENGLVRVAVAVGEVRTSPLGFLRKVESLPHCSN